MTARRVLVTGAGATGVGGAVIQALRMADPAGDRWEITAADAHPWSWGLYVTGRRHLVPWASDPAYLDVIRDLAAQHDAIIPGTEAETVLLAEHAAELGGCAVIANDARLMPLMRNKRLAAARLSELGFASVPSFPWADRYGAVAEFGWPVVVKPTWESSGGRGVHICTTWADLDGLVPDEAHAPAVYPYLGDAGAEYTVGVLSGRDGTVWGSIAIRRELTGLSLREAREWQGRRLAVSTGFTQGTIVRDPAVQGPCEDLARRLGSTGPLNLQLRVVDGRPVFFEVHPRFSFSAPIRASAGFNEPGLLLRHWLDGETPLPGPLPYRDGVAAIRFLDHVLVPEKDLCW